MRKSCSKGLGVEISPKCSFRDLLLHEQISICYDFFKQKFKIDMTLTENERSSSYKIMQSDDDNFIKR